MNSPADLTTALATISDRDLRALLAAIEDSPNVVPGLRPEHADMLRWCGGAFDPAGFDLNTVNAALRRVKIPSRRSSPDCYA